MTLRSVAALALTCTLTVLAAGCAAGVDRPLGVAGSDARAAATSSSLAKKKQRVRFVIHVPKLRHKHHPKYLSPSTESMGIVVSLGGTTKISQNVDLTLGSSGCQSTAVNAQCVLTLSLAPANGYVASFTTYDGPNGTGKVLSVAANTVFNVVKGQNTFVGVSLNGAPASLSTYSAGPNAFYAAVLDADGNFIVGPGAPTIKAIGHGTTVATITQPTTSAPNTIRLAPISGTAGIETFDIAAGYGLGSTNACAVASAICTFSDVATVHNGQELFLANYYAYANESILAFSVPLVSSTQTPDQIIPFNYPGAIATDSSSNLLAAQYTASGSLYQYAPPYGSVTNSATGVHTALGLAIASDGTVFSTGGAEVNTFSSPYTGTATTFAGPTGSSAVAVDASKNIYVAGSSALEVFNPPYTSGSTPQYTVTLASSGQPGDSILIANNLLYVGEQNDVQVFSLPITSNTPTPVATIASGIDYAYGLTVDPNGNLYVANYYTSGTTGGDVQIYDAPITSASTPVATLVASNSPQSVVLDTSGNLYVSTYEGGPGDEGTLQEFKPPFSSFSTPAYEITQNLYYPYGQSLAITPTSMFTIKLNQ